MRKLMVVLVAVLAGGCSTGYWPKVEGDTGAKYQADVRECQTATLDHAAYELAGAAGAAMASKTVEGRAAIDACMAQKGYRITKG